MGSQTIAKLVCHCNFTLVYFRYIDLLNGSNKKESSKNKIIVPQFYVSITNVDIYIYISYCSDLGVDRGWKCHDIITKVWHYLSKCPSSIYFRITKNLHKSHSFIIFFGWNLWSPHFWPRASHGPSGPSSQAMATRAAVVRGVPWLSLSRTSFSWSSTSWWNSRFVASWGTLVIWCLLVYKAHEYYSYK